MKGLSDRQSEILCFIKRMVSEKGCPPTRNEIKDHFGFQSANAAKCHIDALVNKGYLALQKGASRGISVISKDEKDNSIKFPMVMTEEQIEAAARLLCEKRGINPDESLVHMTVDLSARKNSVMWQKVAMEIRAHHEVLTSIATVMDMGNK